MKFALVRRTYRDFFDGNTSAEAEMGPKNAKKFIDQYNDLVAKARKKHKEAGKKD